MSVKKDKKVEVIVEKLFPKEATVFSEKTVTLNVDRIVEVPQEKTFEKHKERVVAREVKQPCERIIEKVVEVPVTKPLERVVERVIEVPIERIVEKVVTVTVTKFVERPVDKVVKILKTVPIYKTVEKKVEITVETTVIKRVEVPFDRVVEKIVEVPVEQYVEKRVEVPYETIIDKTIHVKNDVIVEKIVEIEVDEEIVEVPVFEEVHHVAPCIQRITLEDQGIISGRGIGRYGLLEAGRATSDQRSPLRYMLQKKIPAEEASLLSQRDSVTKEVETALSEAKTIGITETPILETPKPADGPRYATRQYVSTSYTTEDSRRRVEDFLRNSPSPVTDGRVVRQYYVPPAGRLVRPLSPVVSSRLDS